MHYSPAVAARRCSGPFIVLRTMTLLLAGLLTTVMSHVGIAQPTDASEKRVTVTGRIVDEATGEILMARLYIRRLQGDEPASDPAAAPSGDEQHWFFPRSAVVDGGGAIEYRRQRQAGSFEMHTTLTGHPFEVDLPVGRYAVTAERGKEYLTSTVPLDVSPADIARGSKDFTVAMRRWIDLAGRGWYSGDTHVHRASNELPLVMLAEDLNVALPLTWWVTRSETAPTQGDKATAQHIEPKPLYLDDTHVIYPVNTEYEIFTVKQVPEGRHTLGAVFVLGHQQPFEIGVPPVSPVAVEARRQGALLDLDKHSWPWSLMLVPIMKVDLFELSNNHVWRTRFGFSNWTIDTLPQYMQLETNEAGFTEWGWIDFGFQSWYALQNCGFRMRPTAGTASGVHPVPLGFGRVYVHLPDGFTYEKWMAGLNAGRSFVTTGPMLFAQVDNHEPGTTLTLQQPPGTMRVHGTVESAMPLDRIEVIRNGVVVARMDGQSERTEAGGYRQTFSHSVDIDRSSWLAVRVFERRPDGRIRFAHTAPVHIDIPSRPLRPRREEVRWIIELIEKEIARHAGVLPDEALAEYHRALTIYDTILRTASLPDFLGSVEQIVAHRGASAEAPENTHASTLRAIESGASTVEVDVRTTSDGQLVLLHDATLDRTTSGSGPVNSITLADLRKLDAGSWFDTRFADERVPLLGDIATLCKGRIDILLDLKEAGAEYEQQVASTIRERGDPSYTIVGVRSVEQARRFRTLLPSARQIGLIGTPEEIEAYAEAGVEMIRLWPRWVSADAALIERVRATGAKLHLNGTTGLPEEVRPLITHNPQSLSSDHPARLLDTLRQLGASR